MMRAITISSVIGHARWREEITQALRRGAIGEAYLFYGPEGVGKRTAARALAAAVNCASDVESKASNKVEGDACGRCRSCALMAAGTHPDCLELTPDGPGIKIEQVRAFEQVAAYRPLVGARRIVLIDPADRLTPAASDALLKVVEDPPAPTLFLFITSRRDLVPLTLQSRCRPVAFAALSGEETAQVLERAGWDPAPAQAAAPLAQGRPGRLADREPEKAREERRRLESLTSRESLARAGTVLEAAEAWSADAESTARALEWILLWSRDLVRIKLRLPPAGVLQEDQARGLAEQWSLEELEGLALFISRLIPALRRNLNRRLVLENVLLRMHSVLVSR